jgi:putative ABC transport system permease protein
MRALWQDLQFAARLVKKAPGLSTIVLATVAIGIAASTTMLSVADALFWQRLPVPHADRIVHIDQRRADRDEGFPLSLVDYQYVKTHGQSFDDLAAHYPTSPMQLIVKGPSTSLGAGEPMAITGSVVTANYFEVLGLQPAAGRFFGADEDQVPGRDHVVVISDALWQREFARDPAALGSSLVLNGEAFVVVGVAPRGFMGVLIRSGASDVWIPSAMFKVGYRYCDAFDRGCTIVQMLGRLKPGVTRAQVQTELDVLAAQLETEFPQTNRGLGVSVIPARGASYPGEDGRLVTLLIAAVGVLLVIACANVAGLLVAQGLGRRREISARLALGASRGRLVQQLLTESIFLSMLGGLAGVVLAFWTVDAVQRFYAFDYAGRAINVDVHMSPTVLAASVALSVLTGVLFGMLPAVRAGRRDIMTALRDESVAGGARRTGLQRGLVIAQVALSVVLVISALLVLRSLLHLYGGERFDPSHVIIARLRPSLVDYGVDRGRAFQRTAIERLEAVPGVIAASPSVYLPVFGSADERHVWRPDQVPERPTGGLRTLVNQVGPRYFQTMGISLIDGREFTDADRPGAADAAIVNDVLSRRLWPRLRAVGQPLVVNGREHTVVGVVPDAQYFGTSSAPQPALYLNYWQAPVRDNFDMDSRTHILVAGDPHAMMATIQRELAALDPVVPLSEDYPLSDRIGFNFQPVRVATTMFLCFGGVALFLSAIGLYGALAFTARLRTREIAIRLALGANRTMVLRQVLAQGATLATLGVIAGFATAVAAVRLLESLLYGVGRYDWTAFIAGPALLAVVALAASYWPARAAARTDPATALRAE